MAALSWTWTWTHESISRRGNRCCTNSAMSTKLETRCKFHRQIHGDQIQSGEICTTWQFSPNTTRISEHMHHLLSLILILWHLSLNRFQTGICDILQISFPNLIWCSFCLILLSTHRFRGPWCLLTSWPCLKRVQVSI